MKRNNQHRKTTSRLVAAAAAAATVSGGIIQTPAAYADVRLNEVMINAPGTNNTQDYIELISTTGGAEAFNYHMVLLEGDIGAAFGTGSIDHIFPLSGSTGTNGLFLRDSFRDPTTLAQIDPNPAPAAETTRQWGVFSDPPPHHENLTITWLLVEGFTGNVGEDLDTDDDGVLDSTPWTRVVDAVGALDNSSDNDQVYASIFGGTDVNEATQGSAPMAFVRGTDGMMHSAAVSGDVGGPYTVTDSDTAEAGYVLSPGNVNNAVTNPAHAWIGAAGASWNSGANWTGGVAPGVAGDIATFDGGGGNTLSVDSDATVGSLVFMGGNHTINAGGGTLTLDQSGTPTVKLHRGHPTVHAPLALAKDTIFFLGRANSLTLTNFNANGFAVTKQNFGHLILGGSTDVVTSGLTVTAGPFTLDSDGTASRVIVAPTLSMPSSVTSRIDLKDNKLITNNPAGTFDGFAYTDIQGMVQKGRNGGSWDGRGQTLFTSMPAALTGLTTLGVTTGAKLGVGATQTDLFAGHTITAASTIVMYTYAGDANLDGLISGDDYTAIDFHIQVPGASGYANGDFNYDGIISGDDYTVIDFNILAQGAPFPVGGTAQGVTAVPEPASACALAALAATAAAASSRRRRR